MKYPFLRSLSVLGTLAAVPFLFGASGGCQSDDQASADAAEETIQPDAPTGADAADATIKCVETVKCPNGAWDAVHCRCALPAVEAGSVACIDNVLCIQGDAWDPVLCRCVPKATDGGGCQSAQGCNGVLPQICMVCADGGTACAHWACSAGQCQTVICE